MFVSEEGLQKYSGVRVLLVEDNLLNQEVARFMLEDFGLVVDVAENGERCLELLNSANGNYALIFMDMQMPVMDGLSATIEMRKLEALAALPVVAMTANVMPEDKRRCLAAGMNDFICKPIMPEAISAVLEKWIDNKS
ncbi:MAG: response regulator [Rhodocyclales bacterium GT-UBC]|nr:MAG: response regulator [Rhodocyclales bacterium GT-UBC]